MRIVMLAATAVLLFSGCAKTLPKANQTATVVGEHESVALNGVDHWFRVAGAPLATSTPVVFLHGGPGQGSLHFEKMVGPYLEDSLRVVYFDQRGSGRSADAPDGRYTVELLVADLDALRQALGADQIALIGQSFGGTLALEYAATHPDRVAAVVLVASLWDVARQCSGRNRTLAERAPLAFESVREQAERGDARCVEFQAFATPAEYQQYANAIMFPDSTVRLAMEELERAHDYGNRGVLGPGLFRSGLGTYAFRNYDRLTMPVLVIAGGKDGTARPQELQELADELPDATFRVYEDSGHFPYLDQPGRFARDVTEFLRRR